MRTLRPGLSGDDPLTTIRLPQSRVFLANHLASSLLITQPEQPKDRTHSNEN